MTKYTGTDYNCPNPTMTWSSAANGGTGGCVTKPSITNPAVTPAATPAAPAGKGQLTYTPLEPLPGGNPTTYNSLSAYLNLMFNILLSIGAMVAVITLVLGGITYIVSEIVDKKAAARRRMQASIIGLLLLLTCWLILNTINPNLTKLCIFNLDATCGGTISAGGQPLTPASAAQNNVPSPAQLQQQEASCKKGGDLCAFNPNQDGSFRCDCAGA